MPRPGLEWRTIARARISPAFRSKSSSITEPSDGGSGVCRNNPPRPTVSARETVRWPELFQATCIPLGALCRGYFLRLSCDDWMIGTSIQSTLLEARRVGWVPNGLPVHWSQVSGLRSTIGELWYRRPFSKPNFQKSNERKYELVRMGIVIGI